MAAVVASARKPVVTATPVAALGPRLMTVTVNWSKSATAGVSLSTLISTPTSAASVAFTSAPAESLLVLGSNSLPPVRVATLPSWPAAFMTAVVVRVATPPAARLPIAQAPEAGSYVPAVGVDDWRVSSPGSASLTTTPLAPLGPRLVTVTVNVTVSPTDATGGASVFSTATSATPNSSDTAVVLSSPGVGSEVA